LDEGQIEPKSEACAKSFEVCIQFLASKLSTARSMNEALFGLFRYCCRTWEDGAVAFCEELIQTALHWKEFGFAEPCPFPLPSPNTATDGWVPSEHWESTELAYQEIFEGMRQEIVGNKQPEEDEPIIDEDDLREMWPFDLKE
jgi:hypothetical protein